MFVKLRARAHTHTRWELTGLVSASKLSCDQSCCSCSNDSVEDDAKWTILVCSFIIRRKETCRKISWCKTQRRLKKKETLNIMTSHWDFQSANTILRKISRDFHSRQTGSWQGSLRCVVNIHIINPALSCHDDVILPVCPPALLSRSCRELRPSYMSDFTCLPTGLTAPLFSTLPLVEIVTPEPSLWYNFRVISMCLSSVCQQQPPTGFANWGEEKNWRVGWKQMA